MDLNLIHKDEKSNQKRKLTESSKRLEKVRKVNEKKKDLANDGVVANLGVAVGNELEVNDVVESVIEDLIQIIHYQI